MFRCCCRHIYDDDFMTTASPIKKIICHVGTICVLDRQFHLRSLGMLLRSSCWCCNLSDAWTYCLNFSWKMNTLEENKQRKSITEKSVQHNINLIIYYCMFENTSMLENNHLYESSFETLRLVQVRISLFL